MGNENRDWELEEGIPQVEDPFIQQYLKGRDALIAEEQKRRHDADFRKSLSPIAARACSIVAQIRAREQQQIWTQGLDEAAAHESDEILYPGVMFHHARGRMEKTNLWKIVSRMPKGSLLHAHIDAMYDLDFLIDQAFKTPGMFISAPKAIIAPKDFEDGDFGFQFSTCSPDTLTKTSLWSEDYEPASLIPVQTAADSFPNGGEVGLRKWVKSRCMITPEHSFHHQHGVDAIWAIFKSTFPIINSILMYEPIFRACFRRMLGQLADDGISYVEFRIARLVFTCEGQDEPSKLGDEFLKIFEEEIARFQQTEQGKSFHGARIIWAGLRFQDNVELVESMKQGIELKKMFPDIISGYDLVGQEDTGRPLVDLVPLLFWFKKQCAEEGVDMPFFFHAGECLGDGDETDQNLFDAILLGTRRIGHGYSLYKHPLLIDLVKQKQILIECCPISNEILRLASSIKAHSLPALLSRGVAVSLSNDDPAILGHGQNGLTHDFWQTLQGLENVGLAGLAMMAQNSIRWSCFEDQTTPEWKKDVQNGILGEGLKAKRLQEWWSEFEKFCEWVVMEFAEFDEDN